MPQSVMERLSAGLVDAGRTLGIGLTGGVIFMLLGLPAPWLSGPAAAVAIATLSGVRLAVPEPLRQTALVFLGATMGATVTPETLALMARWPLSLLGLVVAVYGILECVSRYLERVHGFDPATARLAAVPGALPYVLALATESRTADARRVAIVQMMRLGLLLICLPSVLALFGYDAGADVKTSLAPVRLIELPLLLIAGALGGYLFIRLRAPAAALFGSMVAGALLYGSGTISSAIPTWLLLPGFVVVGSMVGANFNGTDRRLLIDTALAGVGSLLIGGLVGLAVAIPVSLVLALPLAQVWLAYAPGGVETITIMALALGLDTAFVGGHHVTRFFGLGLLVPFWLGDLARGGVPPASDGERGS